MTMHEVVFSKWRNLLINNKEITYKPHKIKNSCLYHQISAWRRKVNINVLYTSHFL